MKIEKLENKKVKFTFEITPDEFEHGLEHAYDQVKENVEIKGFRKGHVPRNIYENKYGVESLYEDALNHSISHKIFEVRQNKDHEVVGQPEADFDYAKVSNKEAFTVSLIYAVKPEINAKDYKGIEVKKIKTTVSDSEVNAEIKTLLEQHAVLELKEGAIELGNTAIFDFEGFVDNEAFEGGKSENFSLEIGSNQFIPGFEEQMIGMKAGDEKDLNVKFPDEYQAENLKGKDAVFKVKVHEVKQRKTNELNDEFAKSLEQENVETVEDLKKVTKERLEANKETEAKNLETETIIDKLLESNPVEIPTEMIDEEVEGYLNQIDAQAQQYGLERDMFLQLSGMNPETFLDQAKVDAEKRIHVSLTMEGIAKIENFKVEEAELEGQFELLSKQYNMEVADIKRYIPNDLVENDLLIKKAYDFVLDNANRG